MMAFFTDRQNIRDLCDMLVIRGHWMSQELSRQASKELHEIADIAAELTAFDESLSDSGVYGSRIKTYLNKSVLEKTNLTNVKAVLDMVNGKAQKIISHGIVSLAAVRDRLKGLHDDITGKYVLLVNWKELESLSEHPIAQRLEQGYRFIEELVSLLRLSLSEEA
jgi:predicted Rdx family selenoprotein